jgi:hypothetical protein
MIWIFVLWWMTGCATVDRSQLADVASTGFAISQGASEANPLLSSMSWPIAGVAKLAITQAVKFTPEPFCSSATMSLTVAGFGAALWNIGTVLGSGPAALPLVALLTWWQWEPWMGDSAETCVDPWHWQPVIAGELGWEAK